MHVLGTTWHEYAEIERRVEVNMSSSLSTSGPSDSDAASSSSSSTTSIPDPLKCPKHSELAGKRKIGANPLPVGKHTLHKAKKIGNIRKKNRQPISELLERK